MVDFEKFLIDFKHIITPISILKKNDRLNIRVAWFDCVKVVNFLECGAYRLNYSIRVNRTNDIYKIIIPLNQ